MALLHVGQVSVRFGGVQALQSVDVDVAAGEVTGLIGPNGAGKTTLFDVVCGLQPTGHGRVLLDGTDITRLKAHARARLGVARTFQRLELFDSMSVRDNIRVAAEVHRSYSRRRGAAPEVDAGTPGARADAVLDRVGLRAVADERADSLPTGLARLVEVGRALAGQPKVLLLDEPSSGLGATETDRFAALLHDLATDGLGILLVEHDVDLVMRVCARVHVLDFGRVIAAGPPADVQRDSAVQAAYLGAAVA
ncbi:MAG: ABC transporter ATP-binding protein [Acidimicrobiales bacterium]